MSIELILNYFGTIVLEIKVVNPAVKAKFDTRLNCHLIGTPSGWKKTNK